MNYYLLLGVSPDADADTIRSAFRALARRYHPDAGEGSSPDRFREILVAYETLNDPRRRGDYDRNLRNKRAPIAQFVEPLRSQRAPEPMRMSPLGATLPNLVHEPRWTRPLDRLIEELFQSWGDVLFEVSNDRDRS